MANEDGSEESALRWLTVEDCWENARRAEARAAAEQLPAAREKWLTSAARWRQLAVTEGELREAMARRAAQVKKEG